MLSYEVPVDDEWHVVELTDVVLHVAAKRARHELYGPNFFYVEFWAEHSDEVPARPRTFRAFRTNQEVPSEAMWCGTTERLDGNVWHLYELLTAGGQAPKRAELGMGPRDITLVSMDLKTHQRMHTK